MKLTEYEYKPLYLSEFQRWIDAREQTQKVELHLAVTKDGAYRTLAFAMPMDEELAREQALYQNYLLAMINNMIVSFGGVCLTIYSDHGSGVLQKMICEAVKAFDLDAEKNNRSGYGTYVNYMSRMNKIQGMNRFEIVSRDFSEKPERYEGEIFSLSKGGQDARALCACALEGACYCSLDIGGNSIKAAVVDDGKVIAMSEYPWFPTLFERAEELLEPIVFMVRLMNLYAGCARAGREAADIKQAFDCQKPLEEISAMIDPVEEEIGIQPNFDGICVGFPDIVVQNKIAGGESYKQLGMRKNPEYETEFEKTQLLDKLVANYAKNPESVMIINDGNAASIIVSIEQAFAKSDLIDENGLFANTIGTEMGTGFVSMGGTVQAVPLEGFQHVIDLGNLAQQRFPAQDVRSILSLNTGIAGTVQKYVSQLGLFRMGVGTLMRENEQLFEEFVKEGLLEVQEENLLMVSNTGGDKRGKLTRRLISMLTEGCRQVEDTFLEMGKALGVLIDQDKLIFPEIKTTRLLSGGIVAVDEVFETIKRGLKQHNQSYEVIRLDENTTFSPLLKSVDEENRNFNVAVGSAYICAARCKKIL